MIGFVLALGRVVSPPKQRNTSLHVVTLLVSPRSLRCASPPLCALYKVRERLHVTRTAESLSTDHSALLSGPTHVREPLFLPITWLTLLVVKVPFPLHCVRWCVYPSFWQSWCVSAITESTEEMPCVHRVHPRSRRGGFNPYTKRGTSERHIQGH